MEIPILKTFQPLERKSVPKVVDKPVEPEIQAPRRPVVPPPQPPVAKPVCIHSINLFIFHKALFKNRIYEIIFLRTLN